MSFSSNITIYAKPETSVSSFLCFANFAFIPFYRPFPIFSAYGMKSGMFSSIHYRKVFNSIVQRIAVNMMDCLISFKFSANMFFYEISMVFFPPIFCFYSKIKRILFFMFFKCSVGTLYKIMKFISTRTRTAISFVSIIFAISMQYRSRTKKTLFYRIFYHILEHIISFNKKQIKKEGQ